MTCSSWSPSCVPVMGRSEIRRCRGWTQSPLPKLPKTRQLIFQALVFFCSVSPCIGCSRSERQQSSKASGKCLHTAGEMSRNERRRGMPRSPQCMDNGHTIRGTSSCKKREKPKNISISAAVRPLTLIRYYGSTLIRLFIARLYTPVRAALWIIRAQGLYSVGSKGDGLECSCVKTPYPQRLKVYFNLAGLLVPSTFLGCKMLVCASPCIVAPELL